MSTRLDRELKALLRKYEPQLARAFIAAIRDITSQAVISDLIDSIRRNDIEAALRAIDFDRAAFSALTGGMTTAFSAGGAATVANTTWRGIGGGKVVVRWDLANPRAQEIINTASSRFITQISEEARKTVREVISTGYSTGRGPRAIATDLVGRVSGSGRVGGVIGLSEPQVQYVGNMRRYIENGDVSAYLGMSRRDKRYDKMVMRGDLTPTQVDKIIERYSDRLLKSRADAIARTETAQAVEASRQEAFAQYQDKTGVPDEAIVRRWDHPGGKNSRDWHSDMNGWEIRGMTQPWVTPRGGRLMFPCDTSLGAGAVEIVNCRCMQTIYIDYKVLKDG